MDIVASTSKRSQVTAATADQPAAKPSRSIMEGTDDWNIPDVVRQNPLFADIGQQGSVIDALQRLDAKMVEQGLPRLISTKKPHDLFGKVVTAGRLGIWNRAGRPEVSIRPGCYWNFDPAIRWIRAFDMTETTETLGLTIAQVGQSEALVVQDPQNRVFVVRNNGFVAYGGQGRFKILAVVDTLNLGPENAVKDPASANSILGWKQDVKSDVSVPGGRPIFVTVATFLNVPANNVAILNQGNEMIALTAGQHVITNPHTTFRSFYSLSERQHTFGTQPAYTLEGVPVVLDLCLRYRIFDPLLLTANYSDPLQAIVNPAQTAVNGVVSRMSYQQFMRAKKVTLDSDVDNHLPWVEGFKADCEKELQHLSSHHGITILSFDVMDRRLEGKLGSDLERQAEIVLQNQMEATQIELRNSINTEKQKGILEVAKVENESVRLKADTEFYHSTRQADANYYQRMKEAAAEAESSALTTLQEAKNIISLAEAKKRQIEMEGEAYASVVAGHAQIMQQLALEVEKRKAMPSNTVWFESKADQSVMDGFNVAKGVALAGKK